MRIASLQYAKMFACPPPPPKQKGRYLCVLFALAEAEGFEPPWAVNPNGFQDRLVVTASIRLRMRREKNTYTIFLRARLLYRVRAVAVNRFAPSPFLGDKRDFPSLSLACGRRTWYIYIVPEVGEEAPMRGRENCNDKDQCDEIAGREKST